MPFTNLEHPSFHLINFLSGGSKDLLQYAQQVFIIIRGKHHLTGVVTTTKWPVTNSILFFPRPLVKRAVVN